MRKIALTLILCGATPAVQDAWGSPPDAVELKKRCRERLEGVEGIVSVGLGGVNDTYSLLIVCRTEEARKKARAILGGNRFEGLKIFWSISGPPAVTVKVPKLLQDKKQPEPEFDPDGAAPPWEASVLDCDIIRTYLKLKPVRHPAGNGRSLKPCKVHHRQVVGAGGGHSYYYTKHRGDCPIRLGRVAEPPWADNTIAWIFRKGFTPAARASFLWPTELRADDKLWARQAGEDLRTRLPYIRAGAEWGYTDSGWIRTRTGSIRTGGRPGEAWTWTSPRAIPYGDPYRPRLGSGCCCGGCVR